MPIYQFICLNCHTEFELIRPFSKSNQVAKCPKCKEKAERQISSFACKTGGYLQVTDKVFQKKQPRTGKKSQPA